MIPSARHPLAEEPDRCCSVFRTQSIVESGLDQPARQVLHVVAVVENHERLNFALRRQPSLNLPSASYSGRSGALQQVGDRIEHVSGHTPVAEDVAELSQWRVITPGRGDDESMRQSCPLCGSGRRQLPDQPVDWGLSCCPRGRSIVASATLRRYRERQSSPVTPSFV